MECHLAVLMNLMLGPMSVIGKLMKTLIPAHHVVKTQSATVVNHYILEICITYSYHTSCLETYVEIDSSFFKFFYSNLYKDTSNYQHFSEYTWIWEQGHHPNLELCALNFIKE